MYHPEMPQATAATAGLGGNDKESLPEGRNDFYQAFHV